ncbi:MAG: Hsp20/alpha crystallin family protein, partial [Acidimicrobiia bacterium]
MRYDPFRELDRFTEGLFGTAARAPWMPMDAVRHDDHVEIHFDLPGVRPDSIDLTVERNVLTVKAERDWFPAEGVEVLTRERTQGAFSRQVLLSE